MTADPSASTDGPVYYQPTDHVPKGAALKMFLAGAAAAVVLGVVHAWLAGLLDRLASPYVNGLGACTVGVLALLLYLVITLLYGVAVGLTASVVGRRLNVRGWSRQMELTALALLLCSLYFAWHFRVVLQDNLGWFARPGSIVTYISNDLSRCTTSGVVVHVVTWLVEAVLILIGVFGAMLNESHTPFCEHCGRWTEAHDDVAVLHAAKAEPLRELLERGEFHVLQALGKPEPDDNIVTSVNLRTCPGCEQSDYMTVRVDRKSRLFSSRTEDAVENLETLKDLTSVGGWRDVVVAQIGDVFHSELVVKELHIPHAVAAALLDAKSGPGQSPSPADA